MMNALADDEQPQITSAEEIRNEENAAPAQVVTAEAIMQEAEEVKDTETEEAPI
jgi:hypothetical protein